MAAHTEAVGPNMQRINSTPRPNWEDIVRGQGLVYSKSHKPDGTVYQYWQEGRYYAFASDEITILEGATATLFDMCVEAGDYIVGNPEIMRKMGIPEFAWPQIIKTWNDEPAYQSVYGRFDFCFDGVNPPKAYEFNADTPTCLTESLVQWDWRTDVKPTEDQWNSIWEKLVAGWTRNLALIEKKLGFKPKVYFAYSSYEESGEDAFNTATLMFACQEAGYETELIFVEDIELGENDKRFYHGDGQDRTHIDVIFKLYPWEFIVYEDFGKAIFADMERIGKRNAIGEYAGGTIWIEAPYKMLWSNKGLMAVLWKLFGDSASPSYDPEKARFLIPTWFEGEQPPDLKTYVRKPLLGREGANVEIVIDGVKSVEIPGDYGDSWVIQEFTPLPTFNDESGTPWHPVIGAWVIDGDPAGMALRESHGYVTDNLSYFAPHTIYDAAPPAGY